MSARPLAYNLVRLILSAIHDTPRGVDRVDFGYMSHLFETWPGEIYGVLPSALGMRFLPRDRVLRGRDRLAALWRENGAPSDDAAFARLIARIAGEEQAAATFPAVPAPRSFGANLLSPRALSRILQVLVGDGVALGRPMRALPPETVYLDIGHYGITFPGAFKWHRHRPDIAPVFLVHDVIPIDFPEFVAQETVAAHHRVMKKVARHARAIIVPTASAGETVRARLAKWQAPDMSEQAVPIHPVSLPIDSLFLSGAPVAPVSAVHPYFVICGAIEPRKNHSLLLDVWDELVREQGAAAPRLVIAGAPGFRASDVLDRLAASAHLRNHVIPARGLSSPALARLMAGARAVLMPSFAEGFGLPPLEAMALGTPALVSDIPAHRDANEDWALFRAPDDREGWKQDILRLCRDDEAYGALKRRLTGFRPATWESYMARIGEILQAV